MSDTKSHTEDVKLRLILAQALEDAMFFLLTQLTDAISVQSVLSAADEHLRYTRLAREKASEIRQAVYWVEQNAHACRTLPGRGSPFASAILQEEVRLACALSTSWAERLEGWPLIWDETPHDIITSAIAAAAGVRTTLRVLAEQSATLGETTASPGGEGETTKLGIRLIT